MVYSILGCGWLGMSLAKHLMYASIEVKGSTRTEEKIKKLKHIGIRPYLIDIEKQILNYDFFECDVLLIMITSKEVKAYKNLIAIIEKSSVKKVIFISSTSVYPNNNKVCTEQDEINENHLLAQVENLFKNNSIFETTIIRFGGLYGKNRHPGNWFDKREIPQPDAYVNMIHKEDCIQVILTIIKANEFGETFNACIDHHPTRREFYTKARNKLGKPLPIFTTERELNFKQISSAKLIKRFNYKFIHRNLLDIIV